MKILRIINLVAAIATVIFNGLSQAIPLNNQTNAEIANRYSNNYFLPANYVFSIWGVIFLAIIAFGIYQALPSQRDNPVIKRIGWWFVISCLTNMGWLVAFQYDQFPLSMVIMAMLLVSLLIIYLRSREPGVTLSTADKWLIRAPFSIYLGWITVATVANMTYVLLQAQWDGLGISYETWGAIMIVVGGLIAGTMAYRFKDLIYAAVIVWAFVGIIARHPNVGVVAVSAGLLAALVALAALIATFINQSGRQQMGRAA
jgi:hypothetical protein